VEFEVPFSRLFASDGQLRKEFEGEAQASASTARVVQGEVESLRVQVHALEAERDRLAGAVRTASPGTEALTGEVQSLRAQVSSLEGERARLREELAGRDERITELEATEREVAGSTEQMTMELEKARRVAQEAASQAAFLDSELAKRGSRIAELEKELATVRESFECLRSPGVRAEGRAGSTGGCGKNGIDGDRGPDG
jgi:chromosome segregation ATPase